MSSTLIMSLWSNNKSRTFVYVVRTLHDIVVMSPNTLIIVTTYIWYVSYCQHQGFISLRHHVCWHWSQAGKEGAMAPFLPLKIRICLPHLGPKWAPILGLLRLGRAVTVHACAAVDSSGTLLIVRIMIERRILFVQVNITLFAKGLQLLQFLPFIHSTLGLAQRDGSPPTSWPRGRWVIWPKYPSLSKARETPPHRTRPTDTA